MKKSYELQRKKKRKQRIEIIGEWAEYDLLPLFFMLQDRITFHVEDTHFFLSILMCRWGGCGASEYGSRNIRKQRKPLLIRWMAENLIRGIARPREIRGGVVGAEDVGFKGFSCHG
jgi:hypothetical protein